MSPVSYHDFEKTEEQDLFEFLKQAKASRAVAFTPERQKECEKAEEWVTQLIMVAKQISREKVTKRYNLWLAKEKVSKEKKVEK